jgi:uncharacterized protein YuzE
MVLDDTGLIVSWNSFLKSQPVGDYDRKRDTLYICQKDAVDRPARSFDVDGEFWLRLDSETNEVVGIEIEDFKSIFLQKHPELARVWKEAERTHRLFWQGHPERKQDLLSLLVESLKELFQAHPRQMRLAGH